MSQPVASSNVVLSRGSWCSLGDEAAKLKSGGCTASNCSNFACKPTQPPGPHIWIVGLHKLVWGLLVHFEPVFGGIIGGSIGD